MEDQERRARLEEIIREGRRVRSSVAQLHSSPHSSPQHRGIYNQFPLNTSSSLYGRPQSASPFSSHQSHHPQNYPQQHHSFQPPLPHHQHQHQHQPQEFDPPLPSLPSTPAAPQPQPQYNNYNRQPHVYQESKETKRAEAQFKESEAKAAREQQEASITLELMSKRLSTADQEVQRLKKAMETLAQEADCRILQLTSTCKEQQEQIKTLVLQRTTSEAEMHHRAMLENRAATARESETYRQLLKQLEEKQQAENNRKQAEMEAKITTVKHTIQHESDEKYRTMIDNIEHTHRRNMNVFIQKYRTKERTMVRITSDMVKAILLEFDQHRQALTNMRTSVGSLKRDFDHMKNTFATDLSFRLSTIAHWSTGAVRVLENQLSRQEDLQEETERRAEKKNTYNPIKDQEYFEALKLRARLN